MTGRQKLGARKRRVRLTAMAGLIVFLGSFSLVAFDPFSVGRLDLLKIAAVILGLVALVASLLTLTLASFFAFRCPGCRGNLAPLVEPLGPFLGLDHRIRSCPFCRADLDADLSIGKPQIDPTWDL